MRVRKLYYTHKNDFLAYNNYKTSKKNAPCVIFLHGLMSDSTSTKAQYLMWYCKNHHYNFMSFDNFGHGESSGRFLDQTIESWLRGVRIVLEELIASSVKIILVGSSLGGWLAILTALKLPHRVSGLICLAYSTLRFS